MLDALTTTVDGEEEFIRASALHGQGKSASASMATANASDTDVVTFIRSAKLMRGYEKCYELVK